MTLLWPSRIVAFFLWLFVAGSASYWILKFVGLSRLPVGAGVVATDVATASVDDLVRVLGPATAVPTSVVSVDAAPAVDPSARMRLLGVVANRRNVGVALISLDGQPARPYRVGSALDGGYKLTSVAARSATLSPQQQGVPPITLELAPPGAIASLPAALPLLRPTGAPQPLDAGLRQAPTVPGAPPSPENPPKD